MCQEIRTEPGLDPLSGVFLYVLQLLEDVAGYVLATVAVMLDAVVVVAVGQVGYLGLDAITSQHESQHQARRLGLSWTAGAEQLAVEQITAMLLRDGVRFLISHCGRHLGSQ